MPRGLITRLIIAFVLAVLCFCGSTFYSQTISADIDDAAISISGNAMTSIEHLTDTRNELRLLDVAMVRYENAATDANRDEVLAARTRVQKSFERYLAEPERFPGEEALWGDMHRGLSVVDQAVDNELDGMTAGRPAVPRVTVAIATAADAIRKEIDFNADHARELAQRIEHDHLRSRRVAILLDILSTLFTAIVGFLALRALQHHHRVVDEHNRLVARRAEELEQFAGRVAHDILGPLSATRMAVSHASGQIQDPALKRTLERGQRGVERVTTIVDGLLRFARAGARPDPGAVSSMRQVVQSAIADVQPLADGAGITLAVADVPSCAVYGHAGVLASVVENLLRNAIKYMGERPERRIDVRVTPRASMVRLEVEDTGPGIPAALSETIFDPHVRGRTDGKPGIGLGLATVKRIAEAHGGSVGFRSRVDVGTTFWVELPRADYDDESRENRASAQAGK